MHIKFCFAINKRELKEIYQNDYAHKYGFNFQNNLKVKAENEAISLKKYL